MTITPQGQLYLCKTKLENDYKNQLTFADASAQLTYFNGTIQHTFDDYTYIKKDNVVQVGKNIDEIIDCNYLFYKNKGFTNKYYFCFISNMEYVNENCTRITFETDCFQTWYFDIIYNKTFVEREHVDDDTVGKHTVPENLETGEYICNTSDSFVFNDLCFLLQTSETTGGTQLYATNVNGIWQMGGFYKFTNITDLVNVISAYTKPDVIKNVYIVPSYLVSVESGQLRWHGSSTPVFTSKTITKQTTIDTYTPTNKKLLCYPYNYLLETNNNGASTIFKWEGFASNPVFSIGGCATVGASIVSRPTSYAEGDETNILIAGKFPTCSWSEDAYTNWLTMNSVNIAGVELNAEQASYVSNIGKMAVGAGLALSGNVLGGAFIGQGIGDIFNTMQEAYQHKLIPDTYKGNINGGDFQTASGTNGFYFYKMSIKKEYAKIIDNYFNILGYKVNSVKVPNITGRTNWNYVKTVDCNVDGNIPQKDLNIIKAMFNNGVTLWHNPSTMLDYSNTNTIVS